MGVIPCSSVRAPSSCSSSYPERIDAGSGGFKNGKVSISPSWNAFIRKITSARFDRWISGWVKRGLFSKFSWSYNLTQIPSLRRPARPAR